MLDPDIKKELEEIAFEMFRDFTKSVIEKHPYIKTSISSETNIVDDLISTIKAAQMKLKEKYQTKSEIEKFQVGFMLGFIRSNLNTKWKYEYIIKQSNEYKEFLVIKALQIFFNDNVLDQISVDKIYTDLLLSDSNLLDIDSTITEVKIGSSELDKINQPTSDRHILKMLENYINRYISDYITKDDDEMYVWPIVKYFNTKGILQLASLSF